MPGIVRSYIKCAGHLILDQRSEPHKGVRKKQVRLKFLSFIGPRGLIRNIDLGNPDRGKSVTLKRTESQSSSRELRDRILSLSH